MAKNVTHTQPDFVRYFSMAVQNLKIAQYALSMAESYAGHPKIKRICELSRHRTESQRQDLTLKLKDETYRWMQHDLNSEELQAIGSIIFHLLDLNEVLPIEDEIIDFIKNKKALERETV